MWTVRLGLFWSAGAWNMDAYSARLVHCRFTLRRYGIGLEVLPSGFRDVDFSIAYSGELKTFADIRELLRQVNEAYPNIEGRLPVIFVESMDPALTKREAAGFGLADNEFDDYPAFCVISDDKKIPAWPDTMLHEICHCSGCPHNEVKSNQNIMHSPRKIMRKYMTQTQIDRLRGATFTQDL